MQLFCNWKLDAKCLIAVFVPLFVIKPRVSVFYANFWKMDKYAIFSILTLEFVF